ncbi:MAG: hypothetical protein FWE53_00690 [Firmicutes bacterium]|nr:hypothetical protein [Bacillota bacterium]
MLDQVVSDIVEAENTAALIEADAAEKAKQLALKIQLETDEYRDEFLGKLRAEISELEEKYKTISDAELAAFFDDHNRHHEKLKIAYEKNADRVKKLILDEFNKEFL